MPDFSFERKLWKQGFKAIAGMDEVGRGSWAGPVVASAVAFAPISNFQFLISNGKTSFRITDSKQMKPRERERAAEWIKENAVSWGIGEVGPRIINRAGMAKATRMAFRRAIAECNRRLGLSGVSFQLSGNQSAGLETENRQATNRYLKPDKLKNGNPINWKIDFLLIDAFYVPYVRGLRRKHQQPIINGDEKSLSIAAASIIAKVYRDALMRRLSRKYPQYKWGRNKGYGAKAHQEAIKKYGITKLHRKLFVATWQEKLT